MNKVLSIFSKDWIENSRIKIPEELEIRFENISKEDEIIAACREMDYLFVPSPYPPITERVLQNIPSIKMIQTSGIGFDKVDVKAATQLTIPVCNSPGDSSGTVAEFAIGQLIALQRQFVNSDRQIKAGNYKITREGFFKSGLKEMCDIRLGLVGFGAIGKKVGNLARLCGSQVFYYDPYRADKKTESEYQVSYLPLQELLSTCDVISLHLPLSDETHGIIGQKEFAQMPPGSILINTSRGELVDPIALAQALESGHLSGAAIDTVYPEPPPPDHPLLNLSEEAKKRLLITPHIAGITKGSLQRLVSASLGNIARGISGQKPRNIVNQVDGIRM